MEFSDWYDPTQTYPCAFCGAEIAPDGYDPCQVSVEAHRHTPEAPGMWSFWAHAACVPKAFEEQLRRSVESEYEFPPR